MTHGESDKKVSIYHGVNLAINFFALCTRIALIHAAWCSISWYILRHFECESQSPTGSPINDFNLPCKALGGFFIGWKVWGLVIRGLPFSDGKLAYILRWYNLCGLLCSIGRNKKSMPCENRNSACWTKQNTAKGAVCPVSDPAGWRLKEYILSAPWGRAAGKAGMAWTSWKSDFCGAWERSAWVAG